MGDTGNGIDSNLSNRSLDRDATHRDEGLGHRKCVGPSFGRVHGAKTVRAETGDPSWRWEFGLGQATSDHTDRFAPGIGTVDNRVGGDATELDHRRSE